MARQNELMSNVTTLVKDPIIPVRFSAALAVGDMKFKPGQAAIESLMRDENLNVQIAAAYALAKLGNPKYSNLIINATRSTDQTLRANSALILGKLGDQGNLPHLNSIVQDIESSDKARLQAVESMAMLKEQSLYKSKLWPLLISKHPDDRVIGIRGMAALGTSEAKNAILTMLDDDIIEVRLCAAGQLARLGDFSGEEEIFNYLSKNMSVDKPPSVSDTLAILAIGWSRSNRLAAFLPNLIKSQSSLQRIITAQSVLVLAQK
jgi:HEAT repeat protein